jgi:hypothetical protein
MCPALRHRLPGFREVDLPESGEPPLELDDE